MMNILNNKKQTVLDNIKKLSSSEIEEIKEIYIPSSQIYKGLNPKK